MGSRPRAEAEGCHVSDLSHPWVSHEDESEFRSPGDDEVSFRIYTEYIYSGQIYGGEEPLDSVDYLRAYATAIHLEDTDFRLALVDTLLDYCKINKKYSRPEAIKFFYKGNTGPCTMRRFLVEMYVVASKARWFDGSAWEAYPAEFVKDVAMGFMLRRVGGGDGVDGWDLEVMKKTYRKMETETKDNVTRPDLDRKEVVRWQPPQAVDSLTTGRFPEMP